MRIKPLGILSAAVLLGQAAAAQQRAADTVMKGSTIEVIQSYKPQVRKAPKPEWLPQLPPADTTRPVLNYDVPQQTLYYSYTSGQLRPLALGRDTMLIPFPNYVKIGGGNLSTLYLDAGIGSIRGRNYDGAVHLHHLSQKGSIANQQSSLSGLEAEGKLLAGNNEWKGKAEIERNQYYFYGTDPSLLPIPANTDQKQAFVLARLSATMTPTTTADDKFTYQPAVSIGSYSGRFNASEFTANISSKFYYRLDSTITLKTDAGLSLAQMNFSDNKPSSNIILVAPGIILNAKVRAEAQLGLAVGRAGNTYLLPRIVASYPIAATQLILSGGWHAGLRQNTYEQLTTENPYIYTNYTQIFPGTGLRQTRSDEIFVSVNASEGDHLTYTATVSWWNFKNLVTYLGQYTNPLMFSVIYNDVSAISLRAGARYTQSSKWSAGISGEFYNYYQGSQKYVWHQPTVSVRADFSIKPIKDLWISAYANIMGGIYTVNSSGEAVMLTPIADIGCYGEYNMISRLSVFLQTSNLMNSHYERWRGYQSYGLNVYGGLRLKF